MATRAETFLKRLRANGGDWHTGATDYETFIERQRVTWEAIDEAGTRTQQAVLRDLRERQGEARGS
jgi:hypothetical protein